MSSVAPTSVTSTPSRERHPSSQSASSPMVMRPAASSSTSSLTTSTSAAPTTHPITLENLLAMHATAPNPTLAALDQALSERNTFSSQNTQLWKLIEKQRSGYNQVLKELERVRSERDAFKARLTAVGLGGELPKKEKEKDRSKGLRTSASNAAISVTTAGLNGSVDPRAGMVRHQSDNTAATSRNEDRPSTPPRQQEPLNIRDLNSLNPQSSHSSGPARSPVSPVVVPPRITSLGTGASVAASSSSSSTPATPSGMTIAASSPVSSTELASRVQCTNDVERAANIPRSLQIGTGDASSRPSLDRDVAHHSHPPPLLIQPPQLQSSLTPPINTTAPPAFSSSSLSPHQTTPSPGMLSPIVEDTRQRESRVSLPDEAKRYIANMGESPVPSPRMAGFGGPQGTPSHRLTPGTTEAPINGAISSPTHTQAQGTESSADAPRRESPTKMERGPREDGSGGGEFLDMDDDEGGVNESRDEEKQPQPRRKSKPRAAVEDFPLPPSHGHIHIPNHPQSPMNLMTPTQAHPQPAAMSELTTPSQSNWQSQQLPSPMDSVPESPLPSSYLSPIKPNSSASGAALTFRALPLVFDDLKTTRISVSHSSIKPNDRGKEVLSFVIEVNPSNGKGTWKVDKLYSDVLGLDQRVRASVGKGVGKKMGILPEGKIWRDHAPAKADQRKAALEVYLQSLIELPVKNKDEVIAFFTSDIVREAKKPVMQAGYKEGYLTKRGKNFGGWKTRYFVLHGPVLEYYESRGGAHLGSITITNAQIGRQQRSNEADDEKNYRHAFLVIEAKKGPSGSHPRHVLCAESDAERDSWVEILVRYVSGAYNDEPSSSASVSSGPSPISVNVPAGQGIGSAQPRSSTSSNQDSIMSTPNGKRATRAMSKDDISRGLAVPISQLAPDASNAKFFQAAPLPETDESYSPSPTKSMDPSPIDRAGNEYYTAEENARRLLERKQPNGSADISISSSLPVTSPLDGAGGGLVSFRANSELGHYPDLQEHRGGYPRQEPFTPEQNRTRDPRRERKSYHPGLSGVSASPPPSCDRAPTPDGEATPVRGGDKAKISGPLSGAPIPAGYKFGSKDTPAESSAASDRREKAKSRSFWGFGRPADKPITLTSRAVFGIPLEESLEVAEIARLPAVVFRSIQYLEAKQAEQEEGIYRLSGSSAVIKGLKDRFNTGDVDLLASDEYWDPHAIAGLLKSYLRELPASILTRDLHLKFLSVIDFVDPQERIRELSYLIASLPIANYSLLRALTAHLILIVQNSAINKMTMRNVGIVFSPTLGIPAGVFSLMLGEFNRVFNVDAGPDGEGGGGEASGADHVSDLSRRNSRQYSDAAADQLLGLSGRTLRAPSEETPSEDGDSISLHYESGNDTTENEATVESSHTRSSAGNTSQHHLHLNTQQEPPPQNPELLSPARSESHTNSEQRSKAAHVAASRGLNIAISKKGNRHSRMMGLPMSPRPPVDSPKSPLPPPILSAPPS
ncbi:RhoGAP-domain-containing protein [Leucogyrophana mollusca]|uniref:RhoGAP-domain-containing protein n=1 Tax=Leucogyrophana mollusca TaxID=85980 RepID=A0ACB8BA78_9AGAM|nr:RhoGAP-domain-containing protein [Leucogyrophana mollusca]